MDNKKVYKIWVFDDARAGTANQALAIAEALDIPFKIKKITYGKLAELPNFIRSDTAIGISKETIADINQEQLPDLIINAGRRAAPFARYIKKKSGGRTKIVQIMYAGHSGLKDFDLVAIPKHDNRHFNNKNIVYMCGAPHRISQSLIHSAATKANPEFTKLSGPFTALIIGGSTKSKSFTENMAHELASEVNRLTQGKGTVLITTSRRTGKIQQDIIISEIKGKTYVYKWNDNKENPYFTYLALADRIVVTGDSVSMCSEACSLPCPVYIYDNPDLLTKKHARFLAELYKKGYAQPLADFQHKHENSNPMPNPAEQIAKIIKTQILTKE